MGHLFIDINASWENIWKVQHSLKKRNINWAKVDNYKDIGIIWGTGAERSRAREGYPKPARERGWRKNWYYHFMENPTGAFWRARLQKTRHHLGEFPQYPTELYFITLKHFSDPRCDFYLLKLLTTPLLYR